MQRTTHSTLSSLTKCSLTSRTTQRKPHSKATITSPQATHIRSPSLIQPRITYKPINNHNSTRFSSLLPRAQPSDDNGDVKYNSEFGYSRKDVILIGVGLIALGYILYYGLQYSGMDAGMAGNWVQLIIILGICIGWVSSYFYRVATKQMTYVKQLEDYEEAVMKKRLEEMPETELESMMEQVEKEREQRKQQRSE